MESASAALALMGDGDSIGIGRGLTIAWASGWQQWCRLVTLLSLRRRVLVVGHCADRDQVGSNAMSVNPVWRMMRN